MNLPERCRRGTRRSFRSDTTPRHLSYPNHGLSGNVNQAPAATLLNSWLYLIADLGSETARSRLLPIRRDGAVMRGHLATTPVTIVVFIRLMCQSCAVNRYVRGGNPRGGQHCARQSRRTVRFGKPAFRNESTGMGTGRLSISRVLLGRRQRRVPGTSSPNYPDGIPPNLGRVFRLARDEVAHSRIATKILRSRQTAPQDIVRSPGASWL